MTQFSVREKSKTRFKKVHLTGRGVGWNFFPDHLLVPRRSFLFLLRVSFVIKLREQEPIQYASKVGRMRRPEHETNDPTTINVSSIYTVVLIRADFLNPFFCEISFL